MRDLRIDCLCALVGRASQPLKVFLEWLDSCRNGMIYDDFATEDDSVEAFAGWEEAQHRKRPFQKVYVDYAQELRSTSKAAAYSPEQNQAECARILVRLARRLGIAVIVGSQVTATSPIILPTDHFCKG